MFVIQKKKIFWLPKWLKSLQWNVANYILWDRWLYTCFREDCAEVHLAPVPKLVEINGETPTGISSCHLTRNIFSEFYDLSISPFEICKLLSRVFINSCNDCSSIIRYIRSVLRRFCRMIKKTDFGLFQQCTESLDVVPIWILILVFCFMTASLTFPVSV